MVTAKQKYEEFKTFGPNGDFPSFYDFLLYESGGDFETYSKLLGYETFDKFKIEINEQLREDDKERSNTY